MGTNIPEKYEYKLCNTFVPANLLYEVWSLHDTKIQNDLSLDEDSGFLHNASKHLSKAVPLLRRLAAGLPPRRPGFDPGSLHVGFVVDKVALVQVFPRVLRYSPVNFIPPVLHY
jgi:hypothetical protein